MTPNPPKRRALPVGRLWPTTLSFCILLLTSIWAGLAYQLSFDRDSTLERREAENDNLARLFEEHVRRTLASASITLKHIETEYKEHGARLSLAQYVGNNRDELAPYSVLSVIGPNGDLVLSTLPITSAQNYRDTENFQAHARDESREPFISKPRIGTLSGRQTVYLSRRIDEADGSFGGYTVAGMDTQYFSNFYDQIDLGTDSVVTLLGSDGALRARGSNVPVQENALGQDLSRAVLLKEHLPRAEHGRFRAISPIDGIRRLYSYRSVNPFPLVVLVGTSEAATLAGFVARKRLYLGVTGVASIVILAFAALLLFHTSSEARMMAALRGSEERYALVERGTNDGIWDSDLQTGESYVSSRGREILGFRDGELQVTEASVFGRLHPDDVARVSQSLEQSARHGTPYRFECRVRHKDDIYRWILSRGETVCDAYGTPVRRIGSITDITEQKNSERHVREQARLLDLIFRHSPDNIVLLDKDYNFVRVSESYARTCKVDVAEFAGQNHFQLYPSDLERELEPFRTQKSAYSRSARPFVFPDHPEWGTTYWDLGLVPILDSKGEIDLFLFTLKDVTGQIRAKERIARYVSQLRALSGRIVALQEDERRALARELHDEIGQGLTAVKIQLQAMAMSGPGRDKRLSAQGLDQVLLTVGMMLDQVRGLSLNLRPMQLDDLGLPVALRSLIERDAAAAGWRTHFSENLSAERLDADVELACYRVAQEALTNAMRHAGASEVWVDLQRSENALRLSVRDNGHGFDSASAGTASGAKHLGLLGMDERVTNAAGRFEIKTEIGKGTEVRATFPILATRARPATRT